METVKQQEEFHLGTRFSGEIQVEILDIGIFNYCTIPGRYETFQIAAGNVYILLTGKTLNDNNGDFFEFVSFDPDKKKLVVRINPNRKIRLIITDD